MPLHWAYWPRLTYDEGLALQDRLLTARRTGSADVVVATEHAPVVSLGPRARDDDLLLAAGDLASRGVAIRRTARGGLATYHGPGQLVLYPIVDVRALGVRRYVTLLEEAALAVVRRSGLHGIRRPHERGVWVGAAKVASVGIHVSAGIASHGLAINLTTDCTPFTWIRPCGMSEGTVASLATLGGRALSTTDAARAAVGRLAAGLGLEPEETPHERLDPGAR